MEPQQNSPQSEEIVQKNKFENLHKVTPLSKYLAMMLFIILPFLGGYIGYTYAPEKVVEKETVVFVDKGVEKPLEVTSLNNKTIPGNKITESNKSSISTTQTQAGHNGVVEDLSVVISTDKHEYIKGETISISVRNELNDSILYPGGGDRFWGIEYFENGEWHNPGLEEGEGFQLTESDVGEDCFTALYEQEPPYELLSEFDLETKWNQKICPFGTVGDNEPRTVEYSESGKYRLVFYYGFITHKDDSNTKYNDPYTISNLQKVYSNPFTIGSQCTFDSDCILVQPDCGDCDFDSISESELEEFQKEKQKRCELNPPADMCDIVFNGEIKCVDNFCQLVE